MKAKVTGVSAWQATPTSGTLDISIPQRYVDSDGNATVRHYSGVLRIDGAGARWMNALNPDEDLWLVVQGPTDPGGPLATFNEILSYGAGSDVRTSFTRRLISSDLNGLYFDYAQPAPVNPAGFGIEPLTMQGARALLTEGTSIFGEVGVVLGELADLQTDTEQSTAANTSAAASAIALVQADGNILSLGREPTTGDPAGTYRVIRMDGTYSVAWNGTAKTSETLALVTDGLLPYLRMAYPSGAAPVLDDGPRLKLMIEQAMSTGKKLIIPDRVWTVKSPQTVIVNADLDIEFAGNAQIRTEQQFVFRGVSVLSTTLTANAARKATTISVTSAAGVQVGDIVRVSAATLAETSWSAQKDYTSTVSAISGSTITLAHPLHFAFTTAETTTVAFWRSGKVNITRLNLYAAKTLANVIFENIKGLTHNGVYLEADPWDVTVDAGPQGVILRGVVDFTATRVRVKNGCYPYLLNYTRNTRWTAVEADACRHPVSPAAWAADVWVDGLVTRDCFSGTDGHPSFNVNYNNVKTVRDKNPSNIRTVGGSLTHAKLHNISASTSGSLFASLSMVDPAIYPEADFLFDDIEWEGNGGIGAWRGRTVTMRRIRAPWVHASAQSANQIGKLILDDVVADLESLQVGNVERRGGAAGLLPRAVAGSVVTLDLNAAGIRDGRTRGSVTVLNQVAGEPAAISIRILDNPGVSSPGIARALLKIRLRGYVRHANVGAWDFLERHYLINHQIAPTSRVDPALQLYQSPVTGNTNGTLALALTNLIQNGITQTGNTTDQYKNHYVQFDIALSSDRSSPFYSLSCDAELMSV